MLWQSPRRPALPFRLIDSESRSNFSWSHFPGYDGKHPFHIWSTPCGCVSEADLVAVLQLAFWLKGTFMIKVYFLWWSDLLQRLPKMEQLPGKTHEFEATCYKWFSSSLQYFLSFLRRPDDVDNTILSWDILSNWSCSNFRRCGGQETQYSHWHSLPQGSTSSLCLLDWFMSSSMPPTFTFSLVHGRRTTFIRKSPIRNRVRGLPWAYYIQPGARQSTKRFCLSHRPRHVCDNFSPIFLGALFTAYAGLS